MSIKYHFVYAFNDPSDVTLIRCKSEFYATLAFDEYRRDFKAAGMGKWPGSLKDAQEAAKAKGWTITKVIDN